MTETESFIRLSKYLSQRGMCSRREADSFIEKGWVRVDGIVVSRLGTKIHPQSHVELSGQAQQYQDTLITLLLNKPIGYVSSQPEKPYKPAISLITPKTQYIADGFKRAPQLQWPLQGFATAGRLDIDSSGLLILTQNGSIASQLIHPDSQIEKEYLVRVDRSVSAEQVNRLQFGLRLDNAELKPAKITLIDQNYFKMILTEGRKRQIRRMCAAVGLKTMGLKRVRIGNIVLGALPLGKWRVKQIEEVF